jgi:hypothetical protein
VVSKVKSTLVTDDDMHWLATVTEPGPVLTPVGIRLDEPGRDGTVPPIDTCAKEQTGSTVIASEINRPSIRFFISQAPLVVVNHTVDRILTIING